MGKSAGRFIADLQASGYHLRLISETEPAGCIAIVFDLRAKKVLFKESAENPQASKAKAEEFVKALVSGRPRVVWQHITA